jgi:hypothetical protein
MTTQKSAIQECRDQLFLDRASDTYLTHVGSNLSMDRPQLGFHNDSLWRAVVRRGAMDYMQIVNLFRDWLDVVVGPRSTVASVLSEDSVVDSEFLMVTDPTTLPRRGTVVVNEGLLGSFAVGYSFLDPLTGKMYLDEALSAVTTANINNAFGTLVADALIGATSLFLRPSEIAAFPITGFPITLLLDAGTSQEEVVQLIGHAVADGPLNISAVSKNHYGPKASSVNSRFVSVDGGGSVLVLSDTSSFPDSGLIRLIDVGYGVSEIIEYYENDVDLNTLYLSDKLTNTYTAVSTPVTLLIPGASVRLAQLQVKGVGWEVYQSEPRKIQIYIPRSINPNRLLDASFLHEDFGSSPADTLAAPASSGDRILKLSDASNFPISGALVVNYGGGTEEYIGYSRIDRYQTRMYVKLSGVSTIMVEDVRPIIAAKGISRVLILGRGTLNVENAVWDTADPKTNTLHLVAPTSNAHATEELCEVEDPNWLYLNESLAHNHILGEAVAISNDFYAGSDIEVGDPTVAPTNVKRYQGHYLYNFGSDSRKNSLSETTLNENLAGPVYLLTDLLAGHTALEVSDARMFEPTGEFSVTIGRYRGASETIETSGVVLLSTVAAAGITLASGVSPGDLVLSVTSAAALPQPSGGAPYGYRIALEKNAGGWVYLTVRNIIGNTVYLDTAVSLSHSVGRGVRLVSDVIMLSDLTEYNHHGIMIDTEKLKTWPANLRDRSTVHLVEEKRTYIEVVSLTNFPSSGSVILNFGSSFARAENTLFAGAVAGATVLLLNDTSKFPASDFMVEIGSGPSKERKHVATNNTGLNQLTLSGGLDYDHFAKNQVSFDPGDQVSLDYSSKTTSPNRILFSDGLYLSMPYQKNVPIVVSAGDSTPSEYGTDYPFVLPSDWEDQLKYLFDWGRAAGVQVIVSTDK